MIRKEDLLEAIAECKGVKNPNANTCSMLASFYTILDHIEQENEKFPQVRYSYQADEKEKQVISYDSGTEFSEILYGKKIENVLPVIDELMTALQVLNPKLYANVIRKMTE